MASVYDLKPRFQALLRPLLSRLSRCGVTANHVTVAAMIGSIVVGAALLEVRRVPALLLLLPVWLFVRMALNAIDGMMARELGMASNLGAILNEVGDVVSDLALYLPLAWVDLPSSRSVLAFAVGAALTEFVGVVSKSIGASRRYDGPMGKSDRAFWVGALALVTFFAPAAQRVWPWLIGAMALLAGFTVVRRARQALRELNGRR